MDCSLPQHHWTFEFQINLICTQGETKMLFWGLKGYRGTEAGRGHTNTNKAQTGGEPGYGYQPEWITLQRASWDIFFCVFVTIGTIHGSTLVNSSTGESSWLTFAPWDITVISCLTSCCSRSVSMCLYIIYKDQCFPVLSVICQRVLREKRWICKHLSLFTGNYTGIPADYKSPWESQENGCIMIQVYLISFDSLFLGQINLRTRGKSRMLTGSFCLLREGHRNRLLFTENVC